MSTSKNKKKSKPNLTDEERAARRAAGEQAVRERRAREAAEREAFVEREIAANDDEPSREETAAKIEAVAAMTRIEIDVSVNGLPAGQKLTVSTDHPFYAGLLEQKMAHVIKEDEG